MPEWTDKDTDKLFQKGANRYDFTYDPTAWEAMEQLLDRDRRRRLLWWWLGAAVILLLVGWMSWRWLSGRASGAEEPVAAQVSQGPEAVSDEVVLAGSPESTGEREPAKTPTSDEISKGHDQAKSPSTATSGNDPVMGGAQPPGPADENGVRGGVGMTNTRTPVVAAESPPTSAQQVPSAADRAAWTTERLVSQLLFPLATSQPDTPALAGHVITPSSPARPGRWRLSASGGPVWASAGLDDFSKPSWRWGGQVSYRLGSVHALSLGAWYTKMYYEAGEGDYTPPKGFWTRRIAPNSTDATCKILEVPLIWQRAPRGYGRSGWQYEAGLVSYWLLAEYYHYDYDLPDDDLIRWWGAHGENHHLFAGGHLAIGHQWALGRHLGLGLQSFVQFPLGGIGHGKVHLYTAGIQLQMSFGRWR